MKKQLKVPIASRKLNLSKRTISNLKSSEMNLVGGGGSVEGYGCKTYNGHCGGPTRNGNSCAGHNTCYGC